MFVHSFTSLIHLPPFHWNPSQSPLLQLHLQLPAVPEIKEFALAQFLCQDSVIGFWITHAFGEQTHPLVVSPLMSPSTQKKFPSSSGVVSEESELATHVTPFAGTPLNTQILNPFPLSETSDSNLKSVPAATERPL